VSAQVVRVRCAAVATLSAALLLAADAQAAPTSADAPHREAGAASQAPARDPLQTPACRRAVANLSDEEAAAARAARASDAGAAAPMRSVDAALAASRRRAAQACLASRADPAPPAQRLLQPPIAVAPLALPAPLASTGPAPTGARTPAPAAAPRAPEKPYAITSCDPGGCWANDGSRLNRVGPVLSGPHGACVVQGSLVQCP
jgi:hypothetical protein